MGNTEGEKTPKSDKPEKPASPLEQSNVHVYPDWATVQAYYGHGAMPPYYNPAVAPAHAAHPYVWAPPQMVPPYGSPYAAMYPHGGIYGASAAPVVATPLTLETPARSSGNNSGSTKKPKESDVNAPSGNGNGNGNGNAESARNGGAHGPSHSTNSGTEGSCDRSEGSTAREDDSGRSYNGASDSGTCNMQIVPGIPMGSTKPLESFPTLTPEINHSSNARANLNAVTTVALRPSGIGDEREIKREKRKQSNRESARRSRLRKQAEMEELGKKVDALTAENLALRSEINKLVEDSEKLRSDNGLLVEKLKDMQGQGGSISERKEEEEIPQINTENLLEKVDSSMSNGNHKLDE